MFGREVKLFTLMGFKVKIDASWFFLAVLITWSLAEGFFTQDHYPDFSAATRWTMAVAGALGFFISIVLHELSHSLVARRYDIPMRGITLFIFGGVAEMRDEPPTAKSEFLMAIAGPIASLALGVLFHLSAGLFVAEGPTHTAPSAVLAYLGLINIVLAVFNMVPAFPLDGGRVLRSALWGWKKDLRKATRTAAAIGAAFGFVLLGLGVLQILTGFFIQGLWLCMIGLFLRGASNMSYQHVLLRKALTGESIHRFMQTDPVCVTPELTLEEVVHDYIYKYHFKMFPVVESDRLRGLITTRKIKELPKSEWPNTRVSDVLEECSPVNTLLPDKDAMDAMNQMNRSGHSRLLVAEGDRLLGIIALKDLLRFLSLKLDLEEGETFRAAPPADQ